jgi:peptide methionine sulfoxide reductase MsrB
MATNSPIVYGEESIMAPKAHGTCEQPVQSELRWKCDSQLADRICCFNRHYAEHAGYFQQTSFLEQQGKDNIATNDDGTITFFDSVTGKPLFVAPQGRSYEEFVKESKAHGWPSFRDEEVVWENVRVLKDGEAVSASGTHLGHNLPDCKGNRYCINLVSVAGKPTTE